MLLNFPFNKAASFDEIVIRSEGKIVFNWLHVSGRQIVDASGNIINLRGVNIHDPFRAPLLEDDYKRMVEWGVKIIRMPIEWNQIEPSPNLYNYQYLASIDRQIELAKKYGIYIVLNVHQYYWSPHFTFFSSTGGTGYGAPFWLVGAYPDTKEGWLDAVTDFWLGKGPNGTEPSLNNPSMMDRYISLWQFLAERYVNEASIASFDLFNEPTRGRLTYEQQAQYLYPFYERLILRIREIDRNHILNYQPADGSATRYAKLLNYVNLTFSFHFYSLKDNYDGNSTKLEAYFNWPWDAVKGWNIPIWIGEVGVELSRTNYDLWANDTLMIISKNNLGWAWYAYFKSNNPGYALLYADGREKAEITNIIKPFLKHL